MDTPAPGGRLTLAPPAPAVPFRHLTALWVQVTGTWCNLTCAHCINASGPREPWLAPMPGAEIRRWIEEAAALGVKEVYFTGGEPLLHREILPLLEFALERASTTVLTNGTLIDEPMADRLAALAAPARYTLEIRVSLDHPEPERNDTIRGRGAFARALAAVRRLHARGLLPILTATETPTAGDDLYDRLRALLLAAGIDKPRVKILPLFPAGRMAGHGGGVSAEMLHADAADRLQCSEARAVAAGGVYACPILAGLPEASLPGATLAEALVPNRLPHPACGVCQQTGSSCRNT